MRVAGLGVQPYLAAKARRAVLNINDLATLTIGHRGRRLLREVVVQVDLNAELLGLVG